MLNVVRPTSDSVVVVVGAGAVGLAALMALKLAPSPAKQVIAVDLVPERLKLAKQYGATDVINSKETPDLKAALKGLTDGKGVDGSIDTTGRPEVLRTLLESSAKKGVVVSVGVGKVNGLCPLICVVLLLYHRCSVTDDTVSSYQQKYPR
jgi:aryl-alcohol dehydrogenase